MRLASAYDFSYALHPVTGYELYDHVYEDASIKMTEVATKFGLDMSTITAIIGGRQGADRVEVATIQRYRSIWRSLYKFSILIGDYESALILKEDQSQLPRRPRNPLPIKLETLLLFMEFMTEKPGVVLKHPVTRQEYKDKHGKLIYCISRYTSPKSLEHLQSAVNKLHSYFPSTKGKNYHDGGCNACKEMARNGQAIGCDPHRFDPQIHRHGNTVSDPSFKERMMYWKKFAKKEYNQKGNLQLLPSEIRFIRQYLLSQNSLVTFMIYVMFLAGIKLFLRVQEVLGMKIEHFEMAFQIVDMTGIRSICVRVKGSQD